jgi:AcrR family transcriptional regulator
MERLFSPSSPSALGSTLEKHPLEKQPLEKHPLEKHPKTSSLATLAPGGRDLSERHREVLRQAMRLIAERGYRGASLRELARRVGMQQPSLYHYFQSKNELVEQILTTFGVGGAGNLPDELPMPDDIADVPAAIAAMVTYLYDYTDWPVFVRFIFNLAFEAPEYAPRLHGMFAETTEKLFRGAVQPYVAKGQISEDDCVHLCRMVVNAVGLSYIEERLLFPREDKHPWMESYVAFVTRFTREALVRLRDEQARLADGPTLVGAAPKPAPKGASKSTVRRAKR